MAGRIVLFGATGYTGTLTAEELAAGLIPAVLAGRDRSRLDRLAAGWAVDSRGRQPTSTTLPRLPGWLSPGTC
ncbi:MAG: hypothetical protein ABI352_08630 [Candidatus Dormibacter sp.]